MLTKQHLREHQSVVHLPECHLGLVHSHADAQSVALGGHALFYQSLHVALQFLHQFHVALSQSFLMTERYHLPVTLVDGEQGALALGFQGVGSHAHLDVGHLVGSHNGTTHEYGLCHHHGTGKHVSRVGTQGVYKSLTSGVEHTGKLRHLLTYPHLGIGR